MTCIGAEVAMPLGGREQEVVFTDDGAGAERIEGVKKIVLIVEDTADFRFLLRLALSGAGYVVEETTNGLEALEYLRTHRMPAAIVVDLRMPIMDGEQFCNVRNGDERLRGVPVLIYSNDPDAEIVARKVHASGYISKFASQEKVVEQVRRVLH